MAKIYSKALDQSLVVERCIGSLGGEQPGPCVIILGGIHGNEPSGVFALNKVMRELESSAVQINGKFIALSGHLKALELGIRFCHQDLNRMWTNEAMEKLACGNGIPETDDEKEQWELYNCINDILKQEKGPFYFMDLHTTSSETMPFLTVNDSLLNLKFTSQFPLPQIFGIEEYLDGPLLSYINTLGYVSFGYEAGQHDDLSSIENHIAFIYLSLVFAGSIEKESINFDHYYQQLAKTTMESRDIYRIFYRYKVIPEDRFLMKEAYLNFQKIKKGSHLASTKNGKVTSPKSARLFMPLYQEQGDDGFFLIKRISPVFLRCSEWMRKWKFDRALVLLPGINWADDRKDQLVIDRRLARWFAIELFHLLGYRSFQMDKHHFKAGSREAAARYKAYKGLTWLES